MCYAFCTHRNQPARPKCTLSPQKFPGQADRHVSHDIRVGILFKSAAVASMIASKCLCICCLQPGMKSTLGLLHCVGLDGKAWNRTEALGWLRSWVCAASKARDGENRRIHEVRRGGETHHPFLLGAAHLLLNHAVSCSLQPCIMPVRACCMISRAAFCLPWQWILVVGVHVQCLAEAWANTRITMCDIQIFLCSFLTPTTTCAWASTDVEYVENRSQWPISFQTACWQPLMV